MRTENNDLPLISIGLPTYNGGKKIVSSLTSILNQGYPHIEVIISDNCSSDDTETICTEFCKQNNFIHYFRQKENIGIIPNFQFVLSKASGKFFMWISDDDSLEPEILQKYVDFLTTHANYTLVSGEIRYWSGNQPAFIERDFSLENNSGAIRVMKYYSKVIHGAIYYGLMRIETARRLILQNRMGEDWHFVAKVAYLGKIKMLECVGYNKKLNGSSRTLRHYAKIIGASWFTTTFPHAQIAIDAFREIITSPIYRVKPLPARVLLALCSTFGILFNHYCREYPFIIGGKVLRMVGFKKRVRSYQNSRIEEKWVW